MATGHKTGGRLAGTPNKKTREITELLETLNCNPIEGMVLIAQDPQNSMELRGRMYSEVAKYVYPQRKAIALAGDEQEPVQLIVSWQKPETDNPAIPESVDPPIDAGTRLISE